MPVTVSPVIATGRYHSSVGPKPAIEPFKTILNSHMDLLTIHLEDVDVVFFLKGPLKLSGFLYCNLKLESQALSQMAGNMA